MHVAAREPCHGHAKCLQNGLQVQGGVQLQRQEEEITAPLLFMTLRTKTRRFEAGHTLRKVCSSCGLPSFMLCSTTAATPLSAASCTHLLWSSTCCSNPCSTLPNGVALGAAPLDAPISAAE